MSGLSALSTSNYFFPPVNTGASECSNKLNDIVSQAYQHLQEPVSRLLNISDLIFELIESATDCSKENWDGYGALPIRHSAFLDSFEFITSMPSWMPHPEVVPESSGDIGFQWDIGSKKKFAVSFRGDNTISYAGLLGATSVISGKEVYCGSIPKVIIESIKRILD